MSNMMVKSALSQTIDRLIGTMGYYYTDWWNEMGDPRAQKYPLMDGGPWATLTLVAGYLYFVKVWGPEYMKDRKPYDLRRVILLYNMALVILNGWLFTEGMLVTNFGLETWGCQMVNYASQEHRHLRQLSLGWLFFFSKIIEFMDTIFFILRKKYSQVSFLHVVHHSLVPILCWIGMKFLPGGANGFFPLLNSLVHTIMYTYYGLSTLGPQVTKYLWWKKYLTKLQMTQFVLIIVNSLRSFFMPNCEFPRVFIYLTLFNASLFLGLFASFYYNAYTLKSKQQQLQQQQQQLQQESKAKSS